MCMVLIEHILGAFPLPLSLPLSLPLPLLTQVELEKSIHRELFSQLASLPYPNPTTALEPPR